MNASTLSLEKFILEVKPVKHFLAGIEEELLKRGETPELPFTSLPNLSKKIWGLKRGLTVVGARTSMGKSAIVLQIALDLAKQGKEVIFLSLEMTVESMVERLFCNEMNIDNFDVLSGGMKQLDIRNKWNEFKARLDTLPLILTCGVGKTFDEINHLIEHFDLTPKVIFIDYIQAVKIQRNEREMLNEYIRQFRETCLKNDIAGVLCSQANRQVLDEDNKEPTLANLKSTGFLEEHADTVILLNYPHAINQTKSENDFIVIIAKQRNGRTGRIMLHYKPAFYKFIDVETKQENYEVYTETIENET